MDHTGLVSSSNQFAKLTLTDFRTRIAQPTTNDWRWRPGVLLLVGPDDKRARVAQQTIWIPAPATFSLSHPRDTNKRRPVLNTLPILPRKSGVHSDIFGKQKVMIFFCGTFICVQVLPTFEIIGTSFVRLSNRVVGPSA